MALKIKHYAQSGHIRSVGDPPNGIVAVSIHNGHHFIVHPKAREMPAGRPGEVRLAVEESADPELEHGAVAITAEEAIEASLHCKRTPWVLWGAAHTALQYQVNAMLDNFDVESAESAVQFAKEIRDQLAVNGLIHRGRRE